MLTCLCNENPGYPRMVKRLRPMDDNNALKARLDDLEMRYVFQQEALDSLSDVVTNQWAEIDRLSAMIERLNDRLEQVEDDEPEDPDQRPPHY